MMQGAVAVRYARHAVFRGTSTVARTKGPPRTRLPTITMLLRTQTVAAFGALWLGAEQLSDEHEESHGWIPRFPSSPPRSSISCEGFKQMGTLRGFTCSRAFRTIDVFFCWFA